MEPDVLAYRRLEALCESIRAELENDRLIADCAVFPVGIDLCSVTAPEYCQAPTAAPTACARCRTEPWRRMIVGSKPSLSSAQNSLRSGDCADACQIFVCWDYSGALSANPT